MHRCVCIYIYILYICMYVHIYIYIYILGSAGWSTSGKTPSTDSIPRWTASTTSRWPIYIYIYIYIYTYIHTYIHIHTCNIHIYVSCLSRLTRAPRHPGSARGPARANAIPVHRPWTRALRKRSLAAVNPLIRAPPRGVLIVGSSC